MDTDTAWLIREKYEGHADSSELETDKGRLAAGEPLAYVIGWQPFLGLRIHLDSKPLIPRPETEWWTEELLNYIGDRPMRVLDLCAGSGAVGCAVLKHVPNVQVTFAELIPEHEQTIRKNIRENGLDESRAQVHTGDLFAPLAGERFDIIAANPPYIPDERALDASVTDFEPREALRAGADGLGLIRRIAAEAPRHLTVGGELWLECDSEHASVAEALIAARALRAELRTDPYGRPRLVVGYY
ncbi:MAG TPA: peptide chain release factor N(5)-glutamine methyltransferase [Candidatus Paceibacterota bacterium]|nr:peptide chain release factor N(5)-glutamine methyltransferase [Candidatus Paceibacterota bacterium]